MPPNPAPHLINHLLEMGLSEPAGMGVAPLSWHAIDTWSNRTGVDLAPWEARLIRRLSVDYLAEARRAEDVRCPPPWSAVELQRHIEMDQLQSVLG